MNVGVDATCWQNNRGYGRHARSLLGALVKLDRENRYAFFLDSLQNTEDLPREAEVRLVRSSSATAEAASADGHRSLRDMWRMSHALSDPGLDVLLFPTIYSYVPVFSRARKIVMIHDIIAEKYPQLTLPNRLGRLFWSTKVALGRRQADAIATVSTYSRAAIAEHFGISPDRIFVVGEAGDPIFRVLENPQPTPRLRSLGVGTSGRCIIYVGGFGPHKNLEALVAAFAQLADRTELADVRLVMVGENKKETFHSHFSTIKQQVGRLPNADKVVFTGYLPDEDLVVLLNLGTVLVLPSLMEGFGLPAIEAAACGCPVIATTASPLSGLLGGGGLYVDPSDSEGLLAALLWVLASEDLRSRMRAAGLTAAGKLTWEAAACQMLGILESVGRR